MTACCRAPDTDKNPALEVYRKNISLKSQDITRKRTAKLVSLYGVVKFSSTVRFRLWQSAKWRGGKYGGVIHSPLRTPGCQVDHTLK